jgi:hypothetical protein
MNLFNVMETCYTCKSKVKISVNENGFMNEKHEETNSRINPTFAGLFKVL